MRVKTLEREGSRKVLLIYPTTLDEYRQAAGDARPRRPLRGHDGGAAAPVGPARRDGRRAPGGRGGGVRGALRRRGVVRVRGRGARRGRGRAGAEERRARPGARGPGERRAAGRRPRDAAARPRAGARVRHAGGGEGGGPYRDGRGAAVAGARAGAVRPGPSAAGSGPHPRRPRPRQGPPRRGARDESGRRPAHRGSPAPSRRSGERDQGVARTPTAAPGAGTRPVPGRAVGNRQVVAGPGRRRGARPPPRARDASARTTPRSGSAATRTTAPGASSAACARPGSGTPSS